MTPITGSPRVRRTCVLPVPRGISGENLSPAAFQRCTWHVQSHASTVQWMYLNAVVILPPFCLHLGSALGMMTIMAKVHLMSHLGRRGWGHSDLVVVPIHAALPCQQYRDLQDPQVCSLLARKVGTARLGILSQFCLHHCHTIVSMLVFRVISCCMDRWSRGKDSLQSHTSKLGIRFSAY